MIYVKTSTGATKVTPHGISEVWIKTATGADKLYSSAYSLVFTSVTLNGAATTSLIMIPNAIFSYLTLTNASYTTGSSSTTVTVGGSSSISGFRGSEIITFRTKTGYKQTVYDNGVILFGPTSVNYSYSVSKNLTSIDWQYVTV